MDCKDRIVDSPRTFRECQGYPFPRRGGPIFAKNPQIKLNYHCTIVKCRRLSIKSSSYNLSIPVCLVKNPHRIQMYNDVQLLCVKNHAVKPLESPVSMTASQAPAGCSSCARQNPQPPPQNDVGKRHGKNTTDWGIYPLYPLN